MRPVVSESYHEIWTEIFVTHVYSRAIRMEATARMPSRLPDTVYSFGSFVLDVGRGALLASKWRRDPAARQVVRAATPDGRERGTSSWRARQMSSWRRSGKISMSPTTISPNACMRSAMHLAAKSRHLAADRSALPRLPFSTPGLFGGNPTPPHKSAALMRPGARQV